MKSYKSFLIIAYIFLAGAKTYSQSSGEEFPVLKGSYLGQKPPGSIPEPFLPGVFKNVHCSPAFSPDGMEVYWRSMDQKALLFMKEVDGNWTTPESVPFKSLFYKQDVPFFSYDGNKLYFITTQPQHWYQLWSDEAIWYVERVEGGWSSPKQVSEDINRIYTHWQFSLSANGNIYFNGKENEKWFIFKSELKEGKYSRPAKLTMPECFAEGRESYFFPFIASDESYLIFSKSINDDQGNLFITLRESNGLWSKEIPLGEMINSTGIEICPIISPDGKYLFFIRNRKLMWVSAQFIEELKKM